MKPPICKKNLADIPGSETFNLIPHLLRLEPSFGRSSVTNKQTDSRIIYNRLFSQTKTKFETSLYRLWIIFQLAHNTFLYYNYLYFGLHESNRNYRYIEFIIIAI